MRDYITISFEYNHMSFFAWKDIYPEKTIIHLCRYREEIEIGRVIIERQDLARKLPKYEVDDPLYAETIDCFAKDLFRSMDNLVTIGRIA